MRASRAESHAIASGAEDQRALLPCDGSEVLGGNAVAFQAENVAGDEALIQLRGPLAAEILGGEFTRKAVFHIVTQSQAAVLIRQYIYSQGSNVNCWMSAYGQFHT